MKQIQKSGLVTKEVGDEGQLVVAFVRYGVEDKDGDVFEQGSLYASGDNVLMAQFNHSLDLPIGVGQLKERGSDLTWDGQLHMESEAATNTLTHIKAMGADQEYSFRAFLEQWDYTENYGLLIKRARVVEVSPVMIGAGNFTGTLSIKSAHKQSKTANVAAAVQVILGGIE